MEVDIFRTIILIESKLKKTILNGDNLSVKTLKFKIRV